jgi:hypothetical protein
MSDLRLSGWMSTVHCVSTMPLPVDEPSVAAFARDRQPMHKASCTVSAGASPPSAVHGVHGVHGAVPHSCSNRSTHQVVYSALIFT